MKEVRYKRLRTIGFNFSDILEKATEIDQWLLGTGRKWAGHRGSFGSDGTVLYLESDGVWLHYHVGMIKLTQLVTLKSELYINYTSVKRRYPLILSNLRSHAWNCNLDSALPALPIIFYLFNFLHEISLYLK